MEVYRDLKYADESEKQNLDLYIPTYKDGKFPLVVFIHGGGWLLGDKNDGQENAWKGLVNNGYALASINYRYAPEAYFPEGLKDCKKALRFLRDHADKYNLDTENVAVVGNSAGGYYALMLATTVNNPEFKDSEEEDLDVKASVIWYSPTDFVKGKEDIFSSTLNRIKYGLTITFTESLFGKTVDHIEEDVLRKASPVTFLGKETPPILLQQGTKDFICPPQQAYWFQEEAKNKGLDDRITLEIFENAGHVDPTFESLKNKVHIRKFLDKHLKNKTA